MVKIKHQDIWYYEFEGIVGSQMVYWDKNVCTKNRNWQLNVDIIKTIMKQDMRKEVEEEGSGGGRKWRKKKVEGSG